MLSNLIKVCSEMLYCPDAQKVKSYLDDRINEKTQKKFQFGYFPNNIESLLSFFKEDDLISYKLLYNSNDKKILTLQDHNLILPYKDVYGNIIAIVGRTILSENQRKELNLIKYKNTIFKKSKHLFGLFEAKEAIIKKNYVYVVEGQFDCIQAHANKIENVVALGSSNISFEQLALLLRYTNNIVLLLDNDEAGAEGRRLAVEKYGKYCNLINKYIPLGFKDLDEFIKDNSELSSDEIEFHLKNH